MCERVNMESKSVYGVLDHLIIYTYWIARVKRTLLEMPPLATSKIESSSTM